MGGICASLRTNFDVSMKMSRSGEVNDLPDGHELQVRTDILFKVAGVDVRLLRGVAAVDVLTETRKKCQLPVHTSRTVVLTIEPREKLWFVPGDQQTYFLPSSGGTVALHQHELSPFVMESTHSDQRSPRRR